MFFAAFSCMYLKQLGSRSLVTMLAHAKFCCFLDWVMMRTASSADLPSQIHLFEYIAATVILLHVCLMNKVRLISHSAHH